MTKRKAKVFFANQQMQETLESLVTRVDLLGDMLIDVEKVERKNDFDEIREIFRGYLSKEDFRYIKRQQKQIKNSKSLGKQIDKLHAQYIKPLLNKVLPEEETRGLISEMANIMDRTEDSMIRFIEYKLTPILFVNRRNKSLDYKIFHAYEVRCNNCNDISKYDNEVQNPIRDKDFFIRYKNEEFETLCLNSKCKNPEETFYISSANNYRLSNPIESAYAQEIGGRMKSGGRLVSKFIDRLANIKPEKDSLICDVAAIRIIAADETMVSKVKDEIAKLAKEEYHTSLRGKVENKNFPRGRKYKVKPKHSAIHIDFSIPEKDFIGGCSYQTFEIQIQDQLGYQQDKKLKDISHPRHVEQQEEERRKKWKPIHRLLEQHLTPLFSRIVYQ